MAFSTTRGELKALLTPLFDGTSNLAYQICQYLDGEPEPETTPASVPSDQDIIIIRHKHPS